MKVLMLVGGKGSRLWPLSKLEYPKQFIKINDILSLFQKTILRHLNYVSPDDIIIITNTIYQPHILTQLEEIDIKIDNIILEPIAKNTAPAIGLALSFIKEKYPKNYKEEIIFVSPSDHIIKPIDKFKEYVKQGEELAKNDYIVTFGIIPFRPETGYGYIKKGDTIKNIEFNAYKVEQFTEKPEIEIAKKYIKSGNYFWNSGMFLFKINTILEEFQKYYKMIYEFIENKSFEDFVKNFNDLKKISIDYAVMEKTNKACVLPLKIKWSDVGSWESVYEIYEKDENNNVKIGEIIDLETSNSLIIEKNKKILGVIGVNDLIIIDSEDALLILKKGNGQKVREILKRINKNN